MARAELTFRQRDLTAAVKAAKAAGCEVARIEVDKAGKIVVITGRVADLAGEENDWDKEK